MSNPVALAPHSHVIGLDLTKTQIINPKDLRPVYSNNASVLITPHDVRMIFSEIVMSGPAAKEPTVELRANITMSPTQFKALAGAIMSTLQGFEKQFGEIAWPPKNQ